MKAITVLAVDDSAIYRSQLRAAMKHMPQVQLVAAVSNGKIALDVLKNNSIDLMILDLEMPELDGLETLIEMKKANYQTKVIMFSSFSQRGAATTLEALKCGAKDFVIKPGLSTDETQKLNPDKKISELLLPKILALFPENNSSQFEIINALKNEQSVSVTKPKVVVIGASTGGPNALETIFTNWSAALVCPILIVQHMPPLFTATLASRLSKISGLLVKEAEDGEILKNQIYIAPGDFHMELIKQKDEVRIHINQNKQEHYVRPAVDPLFRTAAEIFKKDCLGIVLTGMGSDGRLGCQAIKKYEGTVIIQSPETCVVFGMPGAVMNDKQFDFVKTPLEIKETLLSKITTVLSLGA